MKAILYNFVILPGKILRDGHRMDATLSYLEEEESEDKKKILRHATGHNLNYWSN